MQCTRRTNYMKDGQRAHTSSPKERQGIFLLTCKHPPLLTLITHLNNVGAMHLSG